jgi:hypothetical protein
MVLAIFTTPLLCVAALKVVLLYPAPWQVAQDAPIPVEWWPVLGGMAWQLPHAGGAAGVEETRAVAIACTWVVVREVREREGEPIPPVLLLIAVWIWVAVLPSLAELASGPWQLAQLLPYRVAPSVEVEVEPEVEPEVEVVPRAVEMAWTWAALREERDFI